VGTVEGRSIVEPIRHLLPGKKHPEDSRFYEASAVDVDPRARTLTCRDTSPMTNSCPEFTLAYDRLVVSVAGTMAGQSSTYIGLTSAVSCFVLSPASDFFSSPGSTAEATSGLYLG
jgi:NADH dehydrogenase FAD-containing subunit